MRCKSRFYDTDLLPAREQVLRNQVLVIINSFNQPTYLLRMILYLRQHGFTNILIIDQASTSVECVSLLNSKIIRSYCKIIINADNEGPRSFFSSKHYETASNYFIYTDPDIELPDELPHDFVSRLVDLERCNKIGKVGCALRIDDCDDFDDKTIFCDNRLLSIFEWEIQFWEKEIDQDIYLRDIDTTFALYNKANFDRRDFFRAVRVAGAYSARHRPWYKDKRIPKPEWDYYLRNTKHSFWFNLNEV